MIIESENWYDHWYGPQVRKKVNRRRPLISTRFCIVFVIYWFIWKETKNNMNKIMDNIKLWKSDDEKVK